jgi:hypothetical protein
VREHYDAEALCEFSLGPHIITLPIIIYVSPGKWMHD